MPKRTTSRKPKKGRKRPFTPAELDARFKEAKAKWDKKVAPLLKSARESEINIPNVRINARAD